MRRSSASVPAKTCTSWLTRPTVRAVAARPSVSIGTLPSRIVPAVGRWIPATTRASVVLPAPLAPISATRSPAAISRSMPPSTSCPLTYAWRTPRSTTEASAGRGGWAGSAAMSMLGDPDEPAEARAGALHVIDQREQDVDRIEQADEVQRRRGRLTDRDLTGADKQEAGCEDRRDSQ